MSTPADTIEKIPEKKKRYSVIILNINSTLNNSPRKRLLNFYSTFRRISGRPNSDKPL
jgi:hypothetical protein